MQNTKRTQGPGREPDNTDEPPKRYNISVLIADLVSRDLATRLGAHYQLVTRGTAAIPALVRALGNDDGHLRLAAAQTLRGIADPASASALTRALDDDDPSVRWVAAEGLIALDAVGLMPALHVLIDNPQPSPRLKESVQHVVLDLSEGRFESVLQPVAQALRDYASDEALKAKVHMAITTLGVTEAASAEGDTAA